MEMMRRETKLTVRSYAEGNHSEREKMTSGKWQPVIIHPVNGAGPRPNRSLAACGVPGPRAEWLRSAPCGVGLRALVRKRSPAGLPATGR
jgi:hypothetical protein